MYMKYLYQSFGQLVVHMLSLRQVVQVTVFVKKREYTFFLIIVTTKEKICEFHLGCCVCILPILLPGKKMLVFFPQLEKSIVVNIIKITAIYLLKPFNLKVFIDLWTWCCWELHITLAKVNKLAYFMTEY